MGSIDTTQINEWLSNHEIFANALPGLFFVVILIFIFIWAFLRDAIAKRKKPEPWIPAKAKIVSSFEGSLPKIVSNFVGDAPKITEFYVRIIDLDENENKKHFLCGTYNVKNSRGSYKSNAPVFNVGQTIDVEYRMNKKLWSREIVVRVREDSYIEYYSQPEEPENEGTNSYDEFKGKNSKMFAIKLMSGVYVFAILLTFLSVYKTPNQKYDDFVYNLAHKKYDIEFQIRGDPNIYVADENIKIETSNIFEAIKNEKHTKAANDSVVYDVYMVIKDDGKEIATLKTQGNLVIITQKSKFKKPVKFELDEIEMIRFGNILRMYKTIKPNETATEKTKRAIQFTDGSFYYYLLNTNDKNENDRYSLYSPTASLTT